MVSQTAYTLQLLSTAYLWANVTSTTRIFHQQIEIFNLVFNEKRESCGPGLVNITSMDVEKAFLPSMA